MSLKFGIREFQLHMLTLMPSSLDIIQKSLDTLGASRQEAQEALGAAQEIGLLAPHQPELETTILGQPVYETALSAVRTNLLDETREPDKYFDNSRTMAFHLPLFRNFEYLVNITPNNSVWGQRLSRREGAEVPILSSYDDLHAWRFVKDEVLCSMNNPKLVDGFNFSESYEGTLLNKHDQKETEIVARFDFGLLQIAAPLPS